MSKHAPAFQPPFVRSAYNYDTAVVSNETALHFPEPSLTQQQFKKDSDPNFIMEQFVRTQDNSLLMVKSPEYGDFSDVRDYQSALNAVAAAEEGFMQLNADIRSRFQNDPGQLLDFLADGRNREEAIKLGLVETKTSPATPPAPPASKGGARPPKGAVATPAPQVEGAE